MDQLLLAATHLRNTAHVFGAVVYTGDDTKFGRNKRQPPYKAPQVDLIIDKLAMSPAEAQGFIAVAMMFGAVAGLLAQWGIIRMFEMTPRELLRFSCWEAFWRTLRWQLVILSRPMWICSGQTAVGFRK